MKTLIFLAFVGAAFSIPTLPPNAASLISQFGSAIKKSFSELKNMSVLDRLKHFRDNCPEFNLSDEAVSSNLDANINSAAIKKGFEEGFTCLTGISQDDFKNTYLTVRPNLEAMNRPSASRQKRQASTAPASFDWRTKGAVTGVKNQGQCGSCWSFSATGAMEGAIFTKTGKLPNLSEQNLVDCVKAASGCNGGWMTDAYNYTMTNSGIDTETSYPYVAKQNVCKFNSSNIGGRITSYLYTNQNDETDLKNKLYANGPIAAAIDATYIQSYTGGIITCPNFKAVNHGILIVGYGTNATSSQDYWIVKNSWGASWGENGYMRIIRNQGVNMGCGLASLANYPKA